MATFFDDFSGLTVAAGIPTGYSATSLTAGDVEVVADAGVPGGKSIRIDNVGSGQRHLSCDQFTASTATQEVAVLLETSTKVNAQLTVGPTVRLSSTERTYYYGNLLTDEVGVEDRVQIRRFVSGAGAVVVTDNTITFAANTVYALRLRHDGSTAYLRWWAPADLDDPAADEPVSWTVQVADTNITSGLVGFGVDTGGSAVHLVHAFGAGTAGDTAPLTGQTQLATPTGFTFVDTADTAEVVGSWTAVANAATYDYDVEEWDGSAWQAFATSSTTDPTVTFTLTDADGVTFGTLYRARVRAVPSSGSFSASDWSAWVEATTDVDASADYRQVRRSGAWVAVTDRQVRRSGVWV